MRYSLSFFFRYFLYWIVFFLILKLVFLLWNLSVAGKLPLSDWAGVFLNGIRMDFSVAAYFMFIPGLMLSFNPFLKYVSVNHIIKWYTLILLILVTFGAILDLALFPHWGARLGILFLNSVTDPVGVVTTVLWWQPVLGFAACYFWVRIWLLVYKRWGMFQSGEARSPALMTSSVMLILTASLIIPIRGGLDRAPLNHSSVYFSENYFANQAALNYFWSFGHDFMEFKKQNNPALYMDPELAEDIVNRYFNPKDTALAVTHLKFNPENPPNVVLIILESFSNQVVGSLGGLQGITPGLDRLSQEGISFARFYATGNRSDKGLSGLLAAYPALMNNSLLKQPGKIKTLDLLPAYFKNKGYDLTFYYGGDINFYNTRLLVMQSGIEKIVSKSDFPLTTGLMSKWGVPDQYLYDRFLDDISSFKKPFFKIIYTVSSHHPYDVPFNKIKGDESAQKYLNSVAYADSCLYGFVERFKASGLWDNTLLIITSDHGSLEPDKASVNEPKVYNIPMVWLGGVVDTTFVAGNFAMQTDLGQTLAEELGWQYQPSVFSKNIFGPDQYAFYFTESGWGYLQPGISLYYDRKSANIRWFEGQSGQNTEEIAERARAYVQYLHADFLKR
jgi:phosphoglycerol transferase MdoB-like AlkP superfamily enzyme